MKKESELLLSRRVLINAITRSSCTPDEKRLLQRYADQVTDCALSAEIEASDSIIQSQETQITALKQELRDLDIAFQVSKENEV